MMCRSPQKEEIKQAIIRKYDAEAEDLGTPAWLAHGDDARVPEKGGANYFVSRKVAMALKLYGNQVPGLLRSDVVSAT